MNILIADDDTTLRLTLKALLTQTGHRVKEARDGAEAVELFSQESHSANPYQLVILDVNMPRMSGLEALRAIKAIDPSTVCLMVTAFADVQCAVEAIKHGAYDYVEKPISPDKLNIVIQAAEKTRTLTETIAFSAPALEYEEGRAIIGGSQALTKVFAIIYKLAKVDTSVLIRGESGTGKELIARALHANSHRKHNPFVAINLAAIPENLIESELFGHERGSFTGADKKKLGKFQVAEGGTIFLDEIGDITPLMQVKLLRVLQEKLITPLGSNQDQRIDVRIIAATNKPLEKMIETEAFRSDLFYRLNVLPIHLPPLRERPEDISALCLHFVKKFNTQHNRNMTGISPEALRALTIYPWPGNIRELENVMERAFILESADRISLESLPDTIQGTLATRTTASVEAKEADGLNYPLLKEQFEKEFILRALKTFSGRINQTAEHTQMTKVTLLRKLEKYGIDARDFHA